MIVNFLKTKFFFFLVFFVTSKTCFAELIITSAQFDLSTNQLFFTYANGTPGIATSNLRPQTTSSISVCVTKNSPGYVPYASDSYCGFLNSVSSFSKNYTLWSSFQSGLQSQFGLGNSGSMLVSTMPINANRVTTNTCIVYESADYYAGRVVTSCVKTVLKPFTSGCDISGPTIIDHGVIDSASFVGKEASINLQITCPIASKVVISIRNANLNTINFNNGIKSEITINGVKYPSPILVDNSQNIILKSTLTSSGSAVLTGNFSNSAVVVVDVI